jgi:hypothetical protein
MDEKTEITISFTMPVKKFPGKACEWCGHDGELIKEDAGDLATQTMLWLVCLPATIFFPMAFFVPIVYHWYRGAYPIAETCPRCRKRTRLIYSYEPD